MDHRWRTGAALGALALLGMLLPLSEARAYPRPPSAAKAQTYDNIMRGGYSSAPQLVFWQARARRNAWYGHGYGYGHGHGYGYGHGYDYGYPAYGYQGYDDAYAGQPMWYGQPQEQQWQMGYAPAQIQPGEAIVATQPQTRVMLGRQQVGVLNQGQQVEALDLQNGWVGVQIEQNGQQVRGWVRSDQVVSAANRPSAPSGNAAMPSPPAPPAEQ